MNVTKTTRFQLQLGLVLSLLQHGVELGRLHDVALDLELAAHEEALSVGLASDELAKVLLGEDECDCQIRMLVLNVSRNTMHRVKEERVFCFLRRDIPSGFAPVPVATWPVSLRSMCQLASSPLAFLRVKA